MNKLDIYPNHDVLFDTNHKHKSHSHAVYVGSDDFYKNLPEERKLLYNHAFSKYLYYEQTKDLYKNIISVLLFKRIFNPIYKEEYIRIYKENPITNCRKHAVCYYLR